MSMVESNPNTTSIYWYNNSQMYINDKHFLFSFKDIHVVAVRTNHSIEEIRLYFSCTIQHKLARGYVVLIGNTHKSVMDIFDNLNDALAYADLALKHLVYDPKKTASLVGSKE